MRIYLDNCCLQHPLDNQTHPRIRVETEAVYALLAVVEAKELVLLDSEALRYEISRIPDEARQSETLALLSLASEYLQITDEIEQLALTFEQSGLSAMDVIHQALTSTAKADYFCTYDDKLYLKAAGIRGLTCKVITLLSLIPEVTK